jgi:hypothetical protein
VTVTPHLSGPTPRAKFELRDGLRNLPGCRLARPEALPGFVDRARGY